MGGQGGGFHPLVSALRARLGAGGAETPGFSECSRAAALVALDHCAGLTVPAAPPTAPLAVCSHFPAALRLAAGQGGATAAIAGALAAPGLSLPWARRKGSEAQGEPFHSGHANALLVGPGALVEDEAVWLGVSLMAPGVVYPQHRHPPEELYFVLSDSDWYREGSGWFSPGCGGLVFNPGGCTHSMRAGAEPLLAVWLLWGG